MALSRVLSMERASLKCQQSLGILYHTSPVLEKHEGPWDPRAPRLTGAGRISSYQENLRL